MIIARHIDKFFGRKQALRDISFEVRDGEIVALLGANGAGKSTLFDILATINNDYTGEVILDGINLRSRPAEARAHLGYVPGRFSLYSDMTVDENLAFFARAYGADPHEIETLAPCLWKSLAPFSHLRAGHLSGGMKQKLSICCAMVHHPSILLLDEPTLGVDPVSRRDVWSELRVLRDKGVSILISTHYIDEAEAANQILFLHEGRQLLLGAPQEILADYPGKHLEEVFISKLSTDNSRT